MLMTIVLAVATLYLAATVIWVVKNAGYLKKTIYIIAAAAIIFAANAIFVANIFGIIIMSICLIATMVEVHACAFNQLSEYIVALSQEAAIYLTAIAGPIAKIKDSGTGVSVYSLFITVVFVTTVAFLIAHRITNTKSQDDDNKDAIPIGAGITAFWLFFSIFGLTILGLGFKIEIMSIVLLAIGIVAGIILAKKSAKIIRKKYGGH